MLPSRQKVAGNDCFSMVAHEGHPALPRVDRTFGGFGHLTSNRPRRNPNANLQQQFVSDPFFTPGRICSSPSRRSASVVGRERRVASGPGFPFPKETEAFPMPATQRVGFDGDQGIPPIKLGGRSDECESDRIGGTLWLVFTFDKKTKLFFGSNCSGGPQAGPHKRECIQENAENGPN